MVNKIIIDTDPGVDDAIAIMVAVASELTVLGLTTVYGNSSVSNSTKNALSILELCGARNAPVYKGASKPLQGNGKLAVSHGDNGMDGFSIKTTNKVQNIGAVRFLRDTLAKTADPIDIVAIGPLTNIANLITRYPDAAQKINQIVIMGGVFEQAGNITDNAEFNVYNDPSAFQMVLQSTIPKVIIPADVCRSVTVTKDEMRSMGGDFSMLTDAYIDYYTSDDEYGKFEGGVMYDLLVVAYLLRREAFSTAEKRVEVCTKPGENYGETTFSGSGSLCTVARKVNADNIKKLLFYTLINRMSMLANNRDK